MPPPPPPPNPMHDESLIPNTQNRTQGSSSFCHTHMRHTMRTLAFCAVAAVGSLAAAVPTPLDQSSCAVTLQGIQACLDDSQSSPDGGAGLCLEQVLGSPGFAACHEAARGVMQACAAQGLGLRACLAHYGGDPAHFLDDDQGNSTTSACRAALEAASQTVAGAEAVLASGRAALTLGLVGKLLVNMNETGLPPMFLFTGHLQSLGDADACKAIGGFQYCWAQLDFLPMARTGLCVPQQCSLDDLASVTNAVLQAVAQRSNSTAPDIDMTHVVGQCGDYHFSANAGTYLMTILTAVLVLLVLGGTWMDYQDKLRAAEEEEEENDEDGGGGRRVVHDGYTRLASEQGASKRTNGNGGARSSEEKDALLDRDVEKAELLVQGGNGKGGNGSSTHHKGGNGGMNNGRSSSTHHKGTEPESLGRRVLACFSLYKTWPSLVGPARPGPFNALDGVRVFSMSWVVLGHLFVFPTEIVSYTNQDAILPPEGLLATYAGQAVISAEFAVDTFFCIGAFVAAYMLTKHLQKAMAPPAADSKTEKKPLGWSWVPMLYVHRYLRLSPLYFYVLGMYLFVMRVVNSGPFWGLLNQDYEACAEWGWTNVLYINTLVPWNGVMGCYAVSWYMSVDFQIFLLLPFMTWAYVKNKTVGYLVPLVLATASCVYAYWLAYAKGTSEFIFGTSITDITSYQSDYYFRAWARAPVYMIGVLCAFFWLDHTAALEKAKRNSGSGSWFTQVFAHNPKRRLTGPIVSIYVVAFVLLGLTCYGATPAYSHPIPKFWDASYLALSRPAWCLGLMLLCFLLFQGYGGLINGLLDNRVCNVLGRLTFAAYLVHPSVIFLVFADVILPAHYSPVWISFNFLGMLTVVFLFSAVGYLLVEKPFANLESVLLSGVTASKKDK